MDCLGSFVNFGEAEVLNNDWRSMAFAQFLLLKALCQLSQRTAHDSIIIFNQTKLIVPRVRIESEFREQCAGIFYEFGNGTQNAFNRSLDLSSALKQGDFLVSGIGSNFHMSGLFDPQLQLVKSYPAATQFRDENSINCSCYTKASCIQPVYTYLDNHTMVQQIPGWRSGCYTQDALFASTFECYFNASCLGHLRQIYDMPFDIQPLVNRSSSQFPPTALISFIAGKLFIDDWQPSYNFTAYYSACAPSTCSYTIDERRGFVVIVGTLVGILGGLTKALDLIVPRAVHFARTTGLEWLGLLANKVRASRVEAFH